ncbi:DNA repair protein REV1-like protein, partial [Euroglyphus maynei]
MNQPPTGQGVKRKKLSRARPKINVDENPAEQLFLADFDDEDDGEDMFEFDDEIIENGGDEADKSRGYKDVYHDYLHSKRLKFDDYCNEQREYLRQLRQRCLEIQQKRGCKFHIDPPVNRFADIPLGDPKWRICDPESLPPMNDYTVEVWEHFNRFYFEPEQPELSTLFKD